MKKTLYKTLGIDQLDSSDQETLLSAVGSIAIEGAMQKLIADFTPDQVAALEQYVDEDTGSESLVQHFVTHHKDFIPLLEAELQTLQKEGEALFPE